MNASNLYKANNNVHPFIYERAGLDHPPKAKGASSTPVSVFVLERERFIEILTEDLADASNFEFHHKIVITKLKYYENLKKDL